MNAYLGNSIISQVVLGKFQEIFVKEELIWLKKEKSFAEKDRKIKH